MSNTLSEEARKAIAEAKRARAEKRLGDAQRYYALAVEIYRSLNQPLHVAHTVRHLGDVYFEDRRADLAEPCFAEALETYRAHRETRPLDLANAIRPMALLKDDADDVPAARKLWQEAQELYAAEEVEAGVEESSRRLAALDRR